MCIAYSQEPSRRISAACRTSPPLDPRLEHAEALLSDFARFWQTEPSSVERQNSSQASSSGSGKTEVLSSPFKPRQPFVRYFKRPNG